MSQQTMQEITFSDYYYDIIPRPTGEEWHALDHSIEINGLQEPIVINEKGVILDGYSRYEICQNRNVPIETRVKSFETREEELRYVLEVNATRRQLNAFQRVELFYDIFEVYKTQAKDNHANSNNDEKKFPIGGSINRYSELVGVGQKRTHLAVKIIESDNEDLKQQCRDGTITIFKATSILDGDFNGQSGAVCNPSIVALLKHFKDTPTHDQLESILQIYRKSQK